MFSGKYFDSYIVQHKFSDFSGSFVHVPIIDPANAQSACSSIANNVYSGTTASTGKTCSGTQVGLPVSWTLNGNFPGSGTMTTRLDVSADYFFVKLVNQSGKPITKRCSNCQASAQAMENLTIPSNTRMYLLDYYKAYINSNLGLRQGVRTGTGIPLPFGLLLTSR